MGLTMCDKVNNILRKYKYAFIVCENTKIKVVSRVLKHSIELLVIENRFDYEAVLGHIIENIKAHPLEYPRLYNIIHKELDEYNEKQKKLGEDVEYDE